MTRRDIEQIQWGRIRQGLTRVVLGLFCLALASCGGSQGNGERSVSRVTRLQLDIQADPLEQRRRNDGQSRQLAPGDPGYVERVQITVNAQDMSDPIQSTFELTESQQQTFSSRLEVPIGTDRTLSVNAFNRDGISILVRSWST